MDSSQAESNSTIFYIGHHESHRTCEVTEKVIRHAQDLGYDMLTGPITNDAFHSRVLTVLSTYLNSLTGSDPRARSIAGQENVPSMPILGNLLPSETALRPGEGIGQLILLASPWIDLCSPDPLISDISRQVLALELGYASFCGASNIMIQGPVSANAGFAHDGLVKYARAIQDALNAGVFLNVQILLPMTDASDHENSEGARSDDVGNIGRFARQQYVAGESNQQNGNADLLGTWDVWHSIRALCKYNSRLSVALSIPQQAPPPFITKRWFSEPVRILEIPISSFQCTTKGDPSLSQAQRHILTKFMRSRTPPWLLLSNVGPLPGLDQIHDLSSTTSNDSSYDPTPAEAAAAAAFKKSLHQPAKSSLHLHYLQSLQDVQPPKPLIELFGSGYQDYLQNPLQPLTDNLESVTYEVFEQDPIKYQWYERAITNALRDWAAQHKPASGPNGRVVVAVVGAGRGPLVTRALQASEAASVEIELWEVEKNPNAFVLLQHHNLTKWQQRVHLVHSDMRSWTGPEYHNAGSNAKPANVDIIVSELLGSFGDNELSPECLDGVQHLLNPTHGISIPTSYTAHLTPISAPKLHTDINARIANGASDATQIPYVVMLHAIDYLSKQVERSAVNGSSMAETVPNVQQAWEFRHPIPPRYLDRPAGGSATASGNEHNRRVSRMEFKCEHRAVCHGLAGYFETVLYERTHIEEDESVEEDGKAAEGKVELSTNPVTMEEKSADMISWFPAYFPLKTPMYVPANSVLVVNMWRQTDGRKVWYEWLVESFLVVGAAASGGSGEQRIRVGSSELHSSVANACLM